MTALPMAIAPATAVADVVTNLINAFREYLIETERTEQLRVRCQHALAAFEKLADTANNTLNANSAKVGMLRDFLVSRELEPEIQLEVLQIIRGIRDSEDRLMSGLMTISASALAQSTPPLAIA